MTESENTLKDFLTKEERNSLFHDCQFGKCSTVTVVELTNEIIQIQKELELDDSNIR